MTEPDLETMGPIDYLVVEFPGGQLSGEATPILLDLVDRGIVRILDVAFAMKEPDGSMRRLHIGDLPGPASGLAAFEGASSDLLGQEDLDAVGAIVEPGSGVGILVYENSWAASLGVALRRGGAQLISNGRIPVQAMLAAIEETEAAARG
jgi:hypothetical protein